MAEIIAKNPCGIFSFAAEYRKGRKMKLSELLLKRSELAAEATKLAKQAAAVSAELEQIDAELFSRMKSLVNAIEGGGQLAEVSTAPVIEGRSVWFTPTQSRFRLTTRRPSQLAKYIVAVLKDEGRPLSRNEIFEKIQERGFVVPGKDPKANLSAHLSYAPFAERNKDGLWELKAEQEEEEE